MQSDNIPVNLMTKKQKGFLIFKIFFSAMVFAFTGGSAATPTLIYQVVKKYKLMSEDEYMEIVALSHSLPGIIGINNSMLTGYKVCGIFGSFMAVLGTALPAFVSMLLVAVIFQELPQSRVVRGAINGIRAISIGILFDTGLRILIRNHKNIFGIAMIILAMCLPLFTKISAFYTVLLSGLIGVVYYLTKNHNNFPAPIENKEEIDG